MHLLIIVIIVMSFATLYKIKDVNPSIPLLTFNDFIVIRLLWLYVEPVLYSWDQAYLKLLLNLHFLFYLSVHLLKYDHFILQQVHSPLLKYWHNPSSLLHLRLEQNRRVKYVILLHNIEVRNDPVECCVVSDLALQWFIQPLSFLLVLCRHLLVIISLQCSWKP